MVPNSTTVALVTRLAVPNDTAVSMLPGTQETPSDLGLSFVLRHTESNASHTQNLLPRPMVTTNLPTFAHFGAEIPIIMQFST